MKYVDLFDLGNKFVLVDLRGKGIKEKGNIKREIKKGKGNWRGGRVKKGLDKRGDQRGVGNQSL